VQTENIISSQPFLELREICKAFVSRKLFGATKTVIAAEDVSFRIDRGEAVALVGESGSGKSTVARLLLRLDRPDAGKILLDGEDVLSSEPRRASLDYRGRVQMVFQDPFGSLNPVHSVAHHLLRPILRHRRSNSSDARAHAIELLETVGLEPAADFIDRHPYELSGGQRQRVAIARALAVEPDLLVADEPTSMLDVSIRVDILNLLARLKSERRLAILLITHDLASARYLADRVLVLFRGRVVESGPSEAVVRSPIHPYTRALLSSISSVDPGAAVPPVVRAADVDETNGCPFAHRCPEVLDICHEADPEPRAVENRQVRCHLYADVSGTTGV